MWRRVRGRLFDAVGVVVLVVWFLGAVAIATGPLGVEPRRGNRWILVLILLAPAAAVIVAEELVHRLRHGPQAPGRHSRDVSRDTRSVALPSGVGRLLCLLRLHSWGPFESDEAGPYRTCIRCGRFWNSRRLGSDGYDRMPPTNPGGGGPV